MENTPDDLDVDAKRAKAIQTMRVIWMIIIAVFAVIGSVQLYEWSRGEEPLRRVMSPLAMIILGIGALIRPGNKQLSYVLTGIAIILVIANVILMIIY
ncbi:MAG: hypothetical protein M3033_14710 [Acidobacteriota bacterium]|nr:hypothetical protein [Acidobacteriota bacterium]